MATACGTYSSLVAVSAISARCCCTWPERDRMEINSDDLKIFVAVIDSGSLSAASVHLGQTTSGVSRALSRLEDKLATSLLTRTTRRMELTEEGQLFLQQARAVLAAMEQAEETIRIRRQNRARLLQEQLALLGQLHAPRGARQQRRGQLVFKPRQGPADARRGLAQVHRGRAERAAVDDGDKNFQVVGIDFHAVPLRPRTAAPRRNGRYCHQGRISATRRGRGAACGRWRRSRCRPCTAGRRRPATGSRANSARRSAAWRRSRPAIQSSRRSPSTARARPWRKKPPAQCPPAPAPRRCRTSTSPTDRATSPA